MMRTRLLIGKILLVGIFLLNMSGAYAAGWFVKENGTGSGTSWDDALSPENFVVKLQDGIEDNDVVYFAAGNYYPGTDRTSFFNIKKGITMIGGFAPNVTGNVTEMTYPSVYETVFNGDIDKNGVLDKNNADKIVEVNTTQKVVLKGIIISGGYRVNVGNNQVAQTAGINVKEGSNLELYFCKIRKNKTEASAGAMYVLGAKVYCYRTVISENEAHNRGAGIRIQNGTVGSNLTLESCLLTNNNLLSEWGGAIQVSGANNPLYCVNTTIVNNTAGRGGAAINSASPVYIVSSTIANNTCSNVDNGQDVRCESVNQMYIFNSIITGYPGKTPNIFVNGNGKSITSSGNNVIGTIGGAGTYTFTPAASDITGKSYVDVFGTNVLSENKGYPQTLALNSNFTLPALADLETFKANNALSADVAKDQRGFDRPETNPSVGAYEKSIPVNYTKIEMLLKMLKDPASNYVFVVAHRGDWRHAPENSVAAIQKAAEMGVDMVEIDIQKTKDGDFVLMHDGNIDRTTNGSGNISNYTVAQLKQFRLRFSDGTLSDETIPTLKEALSACKGRVLVNIDKGGDVLDQIIPIIKETETEDHVILKGSGSVESVKSMLGSHLNLIYMPLIDLEATNAESVFNSFSSQMSPYAYEVSFKGLNFSPLDFDQAIAHSGSRVWINALWESLCGGHEDEKAMSNPDANWGWILNQRASIIQTDRPKELIDYLRGKGLRTIKGISIKKAPQGYVPVLDGKGSDPIWAKTASHTLSDFIGGTLTEAPSAEDHSASFKAFWTENGIYIYGERTDDVVSEKGDSVSESKYDMFRVFFNPTGTKDTQVDSPFGRPNERSVGDVYPQSRSTMAYVFVGDDSKVPDGMMKRWEVFGTGNESNEWPSLVGDKGQKVIHHKTDKGYSFEFFVPFSTIIPEETALGMTNGIPEKIGFNMESYDGDEPDSVASATKSILSWNENPTKSDARYDINTFGEMFLSRDVVNPQQNKAPSFTNISEANGIEKISNGAGAWGDYNNDGFLDLFCVGSNINNSWAEVAYLYKNDGNGGFTKETIATIPGIREAACAWLDFNNDGNLDLIVAGAKGANKANASTRLYKNLGESAAYGFEEVANTGFDSMFNETEKCYRYLAVGDYDNDGYTDVLITGQDKNGARRTDLYKNDNGTGAFAKQTKILNDGTLRPFSSGSVSFGDMDRDGYLDILSSGYGDPFGSDPTEKGAFRVYRNKRDGSFERLAFGSEDWGTFLGQCSWADVNGDGYLDFIVTGKHRNDSNQDINQAKMYLNDGAGGFTLVQSSEANLEPLNTSGLDWADVNNDGYLDLVMNGSGNTSSGKTWVYLNDGTGKFYPYITAIKPVRTSIAAVADYNKDGFADAFICGYRDGDGGGSVGEIWKNDGGEGLAPNAAPSAPVGLTASYSEGKANFSWSEAIDDHTPSASLKYNLYIKSQTGKVIYMTLPADIATGSLKVGETTTGLMTTSLSVPVSADGTYTWGIQSIDNGKSGSPFSSAQLVVVGTTGLEHNGMQQVKVYTNNSSIYVNTNTLAINVSVYDIAGMCLFSEDVHTNGKLGRSFVPGIYSVRIKSNEGIMTNKVVVQ